MEGEDPAGVREAAGSPRAAPEVQKQEQSYDIGECYKCQDENKNLHAKLMEEQKPLLEDLQQKVETTFQGELQLAEVPDNLKLEAIRLNSKSICTSQMELMQMNLTKEKETALMELREMLNDKHAQEIAVLQSRYHFELEHVNKQNQKEKEEMVLKHQLNMDEMKEKISLEMEEKHIHILENLKKEWTLNVDVSLKNVSEELPVKHQTELNKLKQNLTAETEELKKTMETLSLEKRQTAMEHKNLENKYHLAMKTLQSKHEKEMQDIKEQNKKQVEELQQEIQKLKAESEEEMAQLWSQLDGARASRQELSELKIQLLARTSHVEELEYLKKDYQLKWDKKKTEHETELEQLRLYFEQKLKSVEENYREELTMLHQRLQEVKDYSIEEMEKSQEQDTDFGPSVTLLEEMTERERLDLFEQLTQQLEHYKEELCSLQRRLDKKHLHEIELLRSTLTLQYEENIIKLKLELSDRYTSEIEQLKKKHCLHLEQLHAKISEEHLKEISKIRQQSTQDAARQIETEVAQRLLLLENEYKNDLGCLQLEKQSISSQQEEIEELKRKNIELKEICIVQEKNVKEELEQIKQKLIEDHTAELRTRKLLQEVEQTHKAEAEEWRHEKEILVAEAEEQLLLLRKELQNKAEYEKQTWQRQFDLREAEMTCLQEQQAALIVELEKTLKEQQNNIQQLEDSLVNTQKTLAQYNSELSSPKTLMAEELEKTKQVLEEEYKAKYKEAQSRFLEENKKNRTEYEILLQKLREKHIEELELQNKELHQKHKQHILSLKSSQEAEIEVPKSTLKRKQQNWLETYVADIQRNNQAHITQLETKHLSVLKSLEATYLFKIKFLQEEHKKDLDSLQIKLKEQLFQKDKENEILLPQELNTIKFAEELQICEGNLKIELADVQKEKHKLMAAEHEDIHKEELTVALETQRHLFEDEHHEALDVLQKTILQMEEEHKRTIQGFQDLHLVEIEKEKEKFQQLQKELEKIKSDKQQFEKEINSLRKEMEKANIEFKKLYPQERENQEENILIAMLRSDIDSYRNERDKLQESCQMALKLLLKMVQSTKDMEDLICKKIGLCLDDSLASGGSQEIIAEETVLAHPLKAIEQWKLNNRICQGEVPDQTLQGHSFDSLELSEHLCESIFENPELIFENEERIKKIGRCLYITVEKLLDMLAESTKQLEEMHNIQSNIKEEYKNKNWEACQMLNEQHELMGCFNEESKAQDQLVLELHKAKGLIEGYLTERHTLEEALNLKEESEHCLVAELEKLKAQIQKLTQHNTRFAEERKLLISQNRALAANVGEREVEFIKEIDRLAKTNLELQCQAEKDCSNLNTQMKILEIELEDQLNKNQNLAATASEVIVLRQQMEALERQLKNQRDFMDKQAIEREHERDEFQEEIQKLEMELKCTTKSQSSGKSRIYLVESLHNEIKERVDDYNRLFTEKEQIEKLLTARNEEIEKLEGQVRELQCLNKEMAKNVDKLMQELEKMKKREIELKEDKGTLQQQHNKNLILISTLQSKLDEVRQRVLIDTKDNMLKEQLKIQEELTTKKREVANLLEQLEKFEENLMNKNEEILQLKSKLEVGKNANINKLIQLKEENAHLKENIEKLAIQCQNPDENELIILQFLKSLLEEKNQETDHLNEQIERLEQKIESSKENEVLEKQMLETEVMKSTIEELRSEKEHLLRNKAEEIEELHKVIKKLQKESGALIPMHHETENGQGNPNYFSLEEPEENLNNKCKEGSQSVLENENGDDNCVWLSSSQNERQSQLEMSLMAKETLQQQLLNENESQFKMEFKILEQNLETVQESSRQHCSELTSLQFLYKELQEQHMLLKVYVMQKEDEMKEITSCRQDLEVHQREREMKLLGTELQLQIVSEQNVEQAAKVQHMTENIVKLENELKIMTQAVHNNETTYQRKINELQVIVAELKAEIEKKVEELELLRSEKDMFHSQLKIPMENDQDNYQKKVACPKTLDIDVFFPSEEKEKGGEERDLSDMLSASVDFFIPMEEDSVTNLQISNRNPNIHNKQPQDIPFIQRKQTDCNEVQQNLKLHFKNTGQSNQDSQNSQISQTIPNCFQNIIMNKTLWDSPENMRKENQNLEFQASLSLTPFSEVDVMHSIAFESLCSENSIIQEDTPRVSEYPVSYCNSTEDAAAHPHFLSSVFSEPTSSVNKCNGLQENVSINNTEVFSLLPPELQDGLKVTMSRLQRACTEYGSNTSLDLILQLSQAEPQNKVCQNSNVMAPLQCFGMTPDVTAPTLKETEMMSQQLKTVLKMVYDESYKILVLSENSLPLDDGDKIQQGPSVEGWQRERLILVDIIQSMKNNLKQSNKENKEEQQPKRVMEHLSSSDRNSLLSDMQDLEVQLRLTQLQSQEKLQELQETLINTENHGKKQEQQLQRQVELLEYKLQQQQSIANDLQASLKHEQEKASEMHELLKQEHTAILNLKSDLCESKETNERLEKSLQKNQNEVIKYSSALENKERSITAAFENLQREYLKNKELQIKLDEQQNQHKIKEDEKSKAIEELQAALELQCMQNNQLTVALEHEQSANSNLRKELQIEHSRCEALLFKDQNKLLELQKNLDIEKKQNADMLTALNHERVLTEHLTMRLNECGSCKHKDSLQELQAQLHLERSNSMKLLAIIEKSQQQIFDSKKQMEEMHLHCKDFQQEQAVQNTIQVTGSMMQNKKEDDVHTLEAQREKEAETKMGWKQLQSVVKSMRDQEIRTVQGERKMAQEQQTECHCLRVLLEAQENQNESTLQYLHNCVRFKELQQMLEDLKNQEKLLKKYNQFPSKNNSTNLTFTTDTARLHVEQQILENIREQLVLVAAYLSEFIYKTIDKTVNWSASNDEIVAALLHILEIKELLASSKPVVIPTSIIHSMQASEGYIYQDRSRLQSGLKAANYAATKTNVPENKPAVMSSTPKIQKLYRKYLRAESFRKALVYQKKYLLLLLGGFQECEQATLSLIARMGIYPSPDLNVSETRSRFFTKFRSAVRVVIAILRLKFLVRKWHKVNKKEMPLEAISSSLGRNSYPVASLEVLKQQQPFPSYTALEGEYGNRNNLMRLASCTVKSLHHLHNRSTSFISQTSSKDPEDSLTEYIAHLETIQERLGILLPGQAAQEKC